MSTINSVITECVTEALNGPRFTVHQVTQRIISGFPDVVTEFSEELVYAAIARRVKKALQHMQGDTEDSIFPELRLPVAIMVPGENGELEYVNCVNATWADLEAGLKARKANIKHANTKYRLYLKTMEMLRPAMEGAEDMTVAQAMHVLAQKAA